MSCVGPHCLGGTTARKRNELPKTGTTNLSDFPLITPELLKSEWRECFRIVPKWVHLIELLADDRVLLVVGRKHKHLMIMPPAECAALFELTRFGHSIVTNARAVKPGALVYAKLSIAGFPSDTMPVRRLFSGATEGRSVKPLEVASDYSAANGYFIGDPSAKKDARAVAMSHAERLAFEVNGMAFDPVPYRSNLEALFALIDSEAGKTTAG